MAKELTYREVEALKKKADVYELSPDARYLFVLDKAVFSSTLLEAFTRSFIKWGINARVLRVHRKDALKIFELEHS